MIRLLGRVQERMTQEMVLLFRPACSPVKVDQGFLSDCYSHVHCQVVSAARPA